LLFVHEGSGVLKTLYGELPFRYGDYLVVPRGTIYQIHFNDQQTGCLLWNRSLRYAFPNATKANTANCWSMPHSASATSARRKPANAQQARRLPGAYQKRGVLYNIHYAGHPFDVVGWDWLLLPFLPFPFTTSNPSPGACISRRPYIKPSRQKLCGVFVCTAAVRLPPSLYPRRTTIVILTQMNYCIMWMATS
jgi:hypothetical protein